MSQRTPFRVSIKLKNLPAIFVSLSLTDHNYVVSGDGKSYNSFSQPADCQQEWQQQQQKRVASRVTLLENALCFHSKVYAASGRNWTVLVCVSIVYTLPRSSMPRQWLLWRRIKLLSGSQKKMQGVGWYWRCLPFFSQYLVCIYSYRLLLNCDFTYVRARAWRDTREKTGV